MLTDREKYILNQVVDGWDNEGAHLTGDISYNEAFEALDKLGLKRPVQLSAFLHEVSRKEIAREDLHP